MIFILLCLIQGCVYSSNSTKYPSKHICDGRTTKRDAIVMLAQKKHSTYDESHSTSLAPILNSLDIYYHKCINEADVLVWHEGDITIDDIPAGLKYPVRLCNLVKSGGWGYPWNGTGKLKIPHDNNWSPGYKHMIRFYSVTSFKILHNLGYTWYLRFDDDSQLLSPPDHNIFSYMRSHDYQYGFRMYSKECGWSPSFGKFVNYYMKEKSLNGEELVGKKSYCKGSGQFGFYNNFFVTNISWWLTPTVKSFIDEFDNSMLIYTNRDNDLIFQTAAVRLFMSPTQVKHFTDFSYVHHTIRMGIVLWGGLETGTSDENSTKTYRDYVEKYYNGRPVSILKCTIDDRLCWVGENKTFKNLPVVIMVGPEMEAPFCCGESTIIEY
jgi:hypothetical protein